MAFSFNDDKPNSPAITRILNFMGWTSIVECACGITLAFSGYPWVNDIYAMAGSDALSESTSSKSIVHQTSRSVRNAW